ncbi:MULTISPECIES: GNVR domain-containing protein [unclassified Caballeronia]|uniref:GNVR domain-containing protein n=1 Tax=unclassified Caballeronia TaxID=2646786 RepID=UPI002867717A|nr:MULTISPECIES: GNVR domain-containing protein [unclassified Caballeronia]MDR5751972.1 GNVR domain-containing protein [Caballeronia sp. LZ024]MDR5843887.1 GNVR domain-containing protein [Caballeronia sp. LZ031]
MNTTFIPKPVVSACAWIADGWSAALPPLAGIAAAVAILLVVSPTYTAKTSFFPPVQSRSSAAAGIFNQLNALSALSGSSGSKTEAEQYVAMLKSRSIADAVVEKFDLGRIYGKKLPEDVREVLAKRTNVSMSSRSELIEVSVDDRDPQRAAKMAAYYIDALTSLLGRVAVTDARQRRVFFERQVDETRAKLASAEKRLRGSGVSPSAAQLDPGAAVGMVAQMNASIAAQEVRLATLRSVTGEANPATLAATSELAALKRRLAEMQAGAKTAAGDEYAGLYRDYKYNSALLELLATQLASARIDEARDGNSLQIVDFATVPQKKSKPHALIVLGTGFAIGIGLSVLAWAVARGAKDGRR